MNELDLELFLIGKSPEEKVDILKSQLKAVQEEDLERLLQGKSKSEQINLLIPRILKRRTIDQVEYLKFKERKRKRVWRILTIISLAILLGREFLAWYLYVYQG